MATHDYNIANQGFPAFRADLNDALAAIVSNNSNATAPATTFAHMLWVDTAANPSVLKIRNADNDAWITIGEIDQTGDKFNLTCANATIAENLTLNAQGDLRFADSDSSNWVAFQAPATVASNVTWTLPATDGTSGQALTTDGSGVLSWAAGSPENGYNFRNRIINGDMRIDQRNAGAGVSAGNAVYVMDRWSATNVNAVAGAWTANQQSISNLAGFNFAYNVNVTTAETSPAANYGANLSQNIEGLNIADFAFGTASAKSITLSFWVYSAVTGTLSGGVSNSAVNRAYVFTYSVSSANTWEYKTVTIPGDTSGTWLTTNGIGMRVIFDLGSGSDREDTPGSWVTSNKYRATGSQRIMAATGNPRFQITGVQLEVGSVATPFERRPYGTELSLCQRYYWKTLQGSGEAYGITGYMNAANAVWAQFCLPVTMRASPTVTVSGTWAVANTGQPTIRGASASNFLLQIIATGTGIATSYPDSSDDIIDASAEL